MPMLVHVGRRRINQCRRFSRPHLPDAQTATHQQANDRDRPHQGSQPELQRLCSGPIFHREIRVPQHAPAPAHHPSRPTTPPTNITNPWVSSWRIQAPIAKQKTPAAATIAELRLFIGALATVFPGLSSAGQCTRDRRAILGPLVRLKHATQDFHGANDIIVGKDQHGLFPARDEL